MTAELDNEHREDGVFFHSEGYDTLCIACTCGWEGPPHWPGVTTTELQTEHRAHVESLPGYVSYFRRPVSFVYDDDEDQHLPV